jgi:hypothetical protein
MKTFIVLFTGFFFCILQLTAQNAQDIIYRTNGDSLLCKITKVDSSNVYFNLKVKNKEVSSFLSKQEILSYKTDAYYPRAELTQSSLDRSIYCITFDPLGFIAMGPTIYSEWLIQKKGSRVGLGIYHGLRITNLGLATYLLLGASEMKMSFTIPLGLRLYPNPRCKADGFFFGPHFEYGRTYFQDGDENQIRAFAADLGYKWVFKNRFTLEFNYGIGLIQDKWKRESVSYGGYTENSKWGDWNTLAFVPYMISLKLGKTF